MRRTLIIIAALGATLAGGVPLAQAQEDKTVGGHIGFVLPLVTHANGQTINNVADQFSIGFPTGITIKGSGRMAFDFEFIPFINTAKPRQTSLTLHPGLIWNVGHGVGVGLRAAYDINAASWGFTPLVNKSFPFKGEHSFFKAYFIEADLPVRFQRPVGGPSANAVTFAMHAGLAF
jgi:hypothetical protein